MIIYANQRVGGNQHLPAGEPGSRVGNQIANGPVQVIEVELFDLSYFPVEAVQFGTL
jgi:hypothetical protein